MASDRQDEERLKEHEDANDLNPFILGAPTIKFPKDSGFPESGSLHNSPNQTHFQAVYKTQRYNPFSDSDNNQCQIYVGSKPTEPGVTSLTQDLLGVETSDDRHAVYSSKSNKTLRYTSISLEEKSKLAGLSIYIPQSLSPSSPSIRPIPVGEIPDSIRATSPLFLDFDDVELRNDLSNGLNLALKDQTGGSWIPLLGDASFHKKRKNEGYEGSSNSRPCLKTSCPIVTMPDSHSRRGDGPLDQDLEITNDQYESIQMDDLSRSLYKTKSNKNKREIGFDEPQITTNYYLNVPSGANSPLTPLTPRVSEIPSNESFLNNKNSIVKLSPRKKASISSGSQISSVFKNFSAKLNANTGTENDDKDDAENEEEDDDEYDSQSSCLGDGYDTSDELPSDDQLNFFDQDQEAHYTTHFNPFTKASTRQKRIASEITSLASNDEPSRSSFSTNSKRLDIPFDNGPPPPSTSNKITQTPDQVQERPPKSKLFGKSFGMFPSNSKLRRFCYKVVTSSIFNQLMASLILVQVALLSYQQWKSERGYVSNNGYTHMDWVIAIFYVVHTSEMIMKSIAYCFYDDSQMFKELRLRKKRNLLSKYYDRLNAMKNRAAKLLKGRARQPQIALIDGYENDGSTDDAKCNATRTDGKNCPRVKAGMHAVTVVSELSKPPKLTRAYLRTDWNRLDFISVTSFWISFFLSVSKIDLEHQIMIFRSLMCLKILRLLNMTHGTRSILKSLRKAAYEARDVFLFLFSFWVLFGIIGVQSFKTSLRRQCVWTNPNKEMDTYLNAFQFCGSYLDPQTGKSLPYLYADGTSASLAKGFTCPVYSKCVLSDNPYGGTVSFDNILHSMEMVFVIISANTFTDIMYYVMDSDAMAASLFFIFSIFILVVWLLSLIVAVIINSYKVHSISLKRGKVKSKKGLIDFQSLKEQYNDFISNYKLLRKFMKFIFIPNLLILAGFIYQASRTSHTSATGNNHLYRAECVITVLLLLEIIVRFAFFLPRGHWKVFFYSIFNCIDLLLAITTSVIIIPSIYHKLGDAYAWVSFFQIARFYRVVMSVRFVKNAWMSVLKSTKPFFDLCIFFLLVIYLFAIIVSRLSEGLIPEDEYLDTDMLIMHNLPNVMLSLYVITSTENWTSILYLAQECGKNAFTKFCVALYLIIWFIFSNMFILNIFIAIITENLGVAEGDKRKKQIKQFYVKLVKSSNHENSYGLFDSIKERLIKSSAQDKMTTNQMIQRMKRLVNNENEADASNQKNNDPFSTAPSIGNQEDRTKLIWDWLKPKLELLPLYQEICLLIEHFNITTNFKKLRASKHSSKLPFKISKVSNISTDQFSIPNTDPLLGTPKHDADYETKKFLVENPSFNTSLYIFPPHHRLRTFCQRIVPPGNGKRIEGVEPTLIVKDMFYCTMFIATIVVVVLTCYITPIYRKENGLYEENWNWTVKCDLFFTLLFTIEFLIKVIADGFLFAPNAYLRTTWDVIDFVVMISFWITFLAEVHNNDMIVVVIGEARALKALRLLTITRQSKEYFHIAVISGAKKMITASLLSLSLLLPFSLWGLNLFAGKLSYCTDGESAEAECSLESTQRVFNWNILTPNVYTAPVLQFNNFKDSVSTLFQIVSLEGWTDLLFDLMNSTGSGSVPETFANPANGLFVIVFLFFSIVFILNLFVSVIISNYSVQTGVAYLTESQHAWYEVKRVLGQVQPSRRKDTNDMPNLKKKCYFLVVEKNKVWIGITNVFVLIHLVGLLTEVYPSNSTDNGIRYAIFVCSTSGLLVNSLLTLYALGPGLFLRNKWNIFRLFVILGGLSLSVIAYFVSRTSIYANFNKLFLVCVLLFLIPRMDTLNQLLKFASASFPSLVALLYTWLVLFLVFAIALNQSFGLTRLGDNTSGNLNCRTVTKSLILLFRSSFGEGWNYVMKDMTLESPFCYSNEYVNSDCGNSQLAYLLFISWNVLSMYIFLNILISVVINSFSYVYHGSGPHSLLTRDEIRKFKKAWNQFDRLGTGLMDLKNLPRFLSSLNGVLSYKVYGPNYSVPEIASRCIIKNSENPYDVSLDTRKLDEIFSKIDFDKVKERRKRYNRLVIEAQLNMLETNDGPKIQFTELLLQVGYYSRFDDSTCLTLEDFVKRHVVNERINKIIRSLKIESTLLMILSRLRFKINNRARLLQTNGRENNEIIEAGLKIPNIFLRGDEEEEETIFWDGKNNGDDVPYYPFKNNPFSGSVSQTNMNPFADTYEEFEPLTISRPSPTLLKKDDTTIQKVPEFVGDDLTDIDLSKS